ncbi:MAG: DegV family protein [Romboutsia sp.]
MNNIKVVCDSLADVPQDIIEKYDIHIIPLSVIFNDKEYVDGIDISKDEFYKMLRENEDMPKTSQVTYMSFKAVFDKYLEEGKTVLYIGGSSLASGTYQSAVMAKNDTEGNLYTLDSLNLSIGVTGILACAGELIKLGKNIDEIIEAIESIKNTTSVFFTVDTLEYLQKGGRVSFAKAAIGNMLNIKPILSIEDGKVDSISQARGKKQVISKIIDMLKAKHGVNLKDKYIVIGCGDNTDDLEILRKKLTEELEVDALISVNIGSCICAHSGPSVVGVACCDKIL